MHASCKVVRIVKANRSNRFRSCVLGIGMCIAAIGILHACGSRKEASYATFGDAVDAGEIRRGWIPDYVPSSSHEIHIVYDPSSPRTWCAFNFSPNDSTNFRKNLKSLDALPQRLKRLDGLHASWWPDFLNGELNLARFHGNGFEAYVATEPDVQSNADLLLFAIDWEKGRAFFYRTAGGVGSTGAASGNSRP